MAGPLTPALIALTERRMDAAARWAGANAVQLRTRPWRLGRITKARWAVWWASYDRMMASPAFPPSRMGVLSYAARLVGCDRSSLHYARERWDALVQRDPEFAEVLALVRGVE